jgi:hypothetical protein
MANEVIEKDIDGIQNLLNQGIDINVKQLSTGSTVLMLACSYFGYEDMVEYLIFEIQEILLHLNHIPTPLNQMIFDALL